MTDYSGARVSFGGIEIGEVESIEFVSRRDPEAPVGCPELSRVFTSTLIFEAAADGFASWFLAIERAARKRQATLARNARRVGRGQRRARRRRWLGERRRIRTLHIRHADRIGDCSLRRWALAAFR